MTEKTICDYCKNPIDKIFGTYIKANKIQNGHTLMEEYHFHTDCFYKMLKKDVMV